MPKITKEKTGETADSVTKLTCQGITQTRGEGCCFCYSVLYFLPFSFCLPLIK